MQQMILCNGHTASLNRQSLVENREWPIQIVRCVGYLTASNDREYRRSSNGEFQNMEGDAAIIVARRLYQISQEFYYIFRTLAVVIESKKMIYASSGLVEALTLAASKFSRTL